MPVLCMPCESPFHQIQQVVQICYANSTRPCIREQTSGQKIVCFKDVVISPIEYTGHGEHVEVTEQRTMQDYARVVRWLVDEISPQAEYIRLVQDNLNMHTPAALYETFPLAEARHILQRVEFHYTPKHGRGANMAEIEIAILERHALPRRLDSEEALRQQVGAVETERNTQRRGIAWQFTSRDARRKLERLYPVKDPSSD